MSFKITEEIGLIVAMLIVSHIFWSFSKRKKFLRQIISDADFLEKFISIDVLKNPPVNCMIMQRALVLNDVGCYMYIKPLLKADNESQQRGRFIFAIITLLIISLSFMLGSVFFVINLATFCFMWLNPISGATQQNALEQFIDLALIIYKWRCENQQECDKAIGESMSLQPLYRVIKKLPLGNYLSHPD